MPQLEITTYPSQIFWLVVSFLVLYLIMSRVIIPKISSVIKSRESEIKNDIHISEQMYKENDTSQTINDDDAKESSSKKSESSQEATDADYEVVDEDKN